MKLKEINKVFSYFYFSFVGILFRILKKMKIVKSIPLFGCKKSYLDIDSAQEFIKGTILKGEPAMIARFGGNETRATAEGIGISLGIRKHFSKRALKNMNSNAGVFPYGEETLTKFAEISQWSAGYIDFLGAWPTYMQNYLINKICPDNMQITHLSRLEPWNSDTPWTEALRGKKVLVIHPFKNTIEKQYQKRALLFKNKNILPDFDLTCIRAVQTIAGETDDRFGDWCEALEYMYNEAMKIDFDVAIIGCGAYGMPLAAKIKCAGKIAIHLGGATQILFGIIGKRWENYENVPSHFNEYWVRPDESETPTNAKKIEDGCYW